MNRRGGSRLSVLHQHAELGLAPQQAHDQPVTLGCGEGREAASDDGARPGQGLHQPRLPGVEGDHRILAPAPFLQERGRKLKS